MFILEDIKEFSKTFIKIVQSNISNYYDLLRKFISTNYDNLIEIIIFVFLIIILYYLLKFLVSQLLKITIRIRTHKNLEFYKERVATLVSVFRSIFKILAFFAILLFVLREFNIQIIPIITGAGVLGAAIVFSFQGIIQDIIRGWILIFEDHARKGEWVNINNTFVGKIVDFDLRGMVLLDRERNYIFLPNSQINTIANLSRHDKKFFVGIRFNKDVNIDEKIEAINKFVEKNASIYKRIYDLKVEEKFNITPEYYEIFISFKTKFHLGEYYSAKIKLELIKEFKDYLREIA
jgi:small conductance mechanosensitive channel